LRRDPRGYLTVKTLMDLIYIRKNKYVSVLIFMLILVSIFLIGGLVYLTGGTTSFVHLMYIPILTSVFLFGIKAGIFFSIVAGLVLGPYMPMVVSQGIMQETRSWVFRIVMFIIIVLVVGVLLRYIREINEQEKTRAYMDIITGFPNLNKFRDDLKDFIDMKSGKYMNFIVFEFSNKGMINQYVDQQASNRAYINLLKNAESFFENSSIYVDGSDRFIVTVTGCSINEVYELGKKFVNINKEPMYIYTIPISVIVKGGIVNYPIHGRDIDDIILKLEKMSSLISRVQHDIIIYDDEFEAERTKYYNTLVSLYHSLKNDMFALAFQPKVHMDSNGIIGVEALLRVKDTSLNISIQQLIKMAEEVGFISEITKWVIENSIRGVKEWKERGIAINVAINLSLLDLKDSSIVDFTKVCLEAYGVDPSFIEFELTERSIIEDERRVMDALRKIKEVGIKLSLDDYGSGYNSLNYLVNSDFYFDYIKIDKSLINNITEVQGRLLCEGIIKTAHVLGAKVIAEGVETEEQVNILKAIGCDIIQGYYFYKPMPEDQLIYHFTILNK